MSPAHALGSGLLVGVALLRLSRGIATTSLSFPSPASKARRLPRLLLHFDVNKTIIISDPAGGVTTQQMVNSIISENAWGRVTGGSSDDDGAYERWELAAECTEPTPSPPDTCSDGIAGSGNGGAVGGKGTGALGGEASPLVSYADLLEGGRVAKRVKKELKTTFTEEGRPGHAFRPYYDRLLRALAVPAESAAATAACPFKLLRGGQVFLLPSFFELVKHLSAEKRDFAIVFRTFGTDLPEIAAEFNLFCAGEHPLHPGVRLDGSLDGFPDRRIQLPGGTGCYVRDGRTPADVHLTTVGAQGVISVAHGAAACHAAICERVAAGHNTLGLQDHYAWWAKCGEADDAGKIMFVDQSDGPLDGDDHDGRGGHDGHDGCDGYDGRTHQIFFDDNVERTHAHIVDIRDAASGETVRFKKARGLYLVRAEPVRSILDREYFIDAVRACEARRDGGGGAGRDSAEG